MQLSVHVEQDRHDQSRATHTKAVPVSGESMGEKHINTRHGLESRSVACQFIPCPLSIQEAHDTDASAPGNTVLVEVGIASQLGDLHRA